MITTILFDMDGTLYDESYPKARAEMLVSTYIGEINHIDPIIVYDTFRASKSFITKTYLGDICRNDRVFWFDKTLRELNITNISGTDAAGFYWNFVLDGITPYDDFTYIIPLLQKKYEIYILTDEKLSICRKKLNKLGMSDTFKSVISSELTGVTKPSKKIFDYTLSLISKSPEEVLMIGDNPSVDILGGNLSGMSTAWLQRGKFYYYQQKDNEVPDITFTNYIQLPNKIDKFLQRKKTC